LLLIKKTLIYIIVVILVLGIMCLNTYSEENNLAIIIADNVNLRFYNNLESEIVTKVPLGERISIIENDNLWYYVKLSDGITTGWILSDLVVPMDLTNAPIKRGIVTVDSLNLREQPSLDGNILKSLSKNTEGILVEAQEGWYKIILDNSITGWVHSNYINTIPFYPEGQIIADNVNLRTIPSTEGKVICQLPLNKRVAIKNYDDNWYEIITPENETGWLHSSYIIINIKSTNNTVSRSMNRTTLKIIEIAKNLLDSPYVYGAEGPSKFDCSGFTHYVFKESGIRIPRTSSAQATVGTRIEKSQLKMGDLVFFDTSGKYNGVVTHVGIYIDNGEFIHASSGRNAKRVVISSLTEGYYNERFIKAQRIID